MNYIAVSLASLDQNNSKDIRQTLYYNLSLA